MKSRSVSPPALLFFFKIFMAILSYMHFHMNFKMSLSISVIPLPGGIKPPKPWVFYKDCVESIDQFGEYCLSLPIHEYGLSHRLFIYFPYHLFKSSFISALCNLQYTSDVLFKKHFEWLTLSLQYIFATTPSPLSNNTVPLQQAVQLSCNSVFIPCSSLPSIPCNNAAIHFTYAQAVITVNTVITESVLLLF